MVDLPEVCPGCVPGGDLMYVGVMWCISHQPDRTGPDDRIASPLEADVTLSGTAEAGGEDNRRLCDLIHRGRDA